MLVRDVTEILERNSPPEYAEDWDNVGLLCGRSDREVHRIMVTLDATTEACRKAVEMGVDMIITHHPMVFGKINRVNDQSVLGRKLLMLIEAGVSCYAMHTNFDTKGGMAKLAGSMLGLKAMQVLEETKDGEGLGVIGLLERTTPLCRLADLVKRQFGLPEVLVFGDCNKEVEKVAVCPGSGKSVIDISIAKGAECLITGDIGHHDGIDAMDAGLYIIDASHYGLEEIFVDHIMNEVLGPLDGVEIFGWSVGRPYNVY
ncbi:MAG: Nif3-like dinuclear metal center hexameric protein [Lachnospiraceae bacterium]|nr:Nif3-like dinuclear metal center hexameric protein [Lachnospiraceae bacterium]